MEQALCLICFHPSRTIIMNNNNLRKVYEQITEIKLEDPLIICSLCHTRLQQTQQLYALALKIHHQNSGEEDENEEKLKLVNPKLSDLICYSVPKYYADQIENKIKKVSKDLLPPATGMSKKVCKNEMKSKTLKNKLPSSYTGSKNGGVTECLYVMDKQRKKNNKQLPQSSLNIEKSSTIIPLEISNNTDMEISLQNEKAVTPNHNSCSKLECKPPQKRQYRRSIKCDYTCKSCVLVFSSRKDLEEHVRVTHPSKKRKKQIYHCQVCGRKCISKRRLTDHTRVHTGEKPYECDECGGRFMNKLTVARHILVSHRNYKPCTCQICGKGFSQKSALRTHMRSHTDERPYPCDCGFSFKHVGNFWLHLRNGAHQRRINAEKHPKFHYCECGAMFLKKESLERHRMNHTYAPVKCGCGVILNSSTGLAVHLRLSKCDHCSQGTTENAPVRTRAREEYSCHCGATFDHKSRLRSHMRVHLMFDVGKFCCPVCGKMCGSRDSLTMHLGVHPTTDFCQSCDMSFRNREDLKLHIIEFHNDESRMFDFRK